LTAPKLDRDRADRRLRHPVTERGEAGVDVLLGSPHAWFGMISAIAFWRRAGSFAHGRTPIIHAMAPRAVCIRFSACRQIAERGPSITSA
jgi:hypothetical protein